MSQIARGSYKTAVSKTDPSGTESRELLAGRLRLADQNTSQENVLRICLPWS